MSLPPHGLSWFRSSLCADWSCVEVAADDNRVYVRDGKMPDGAVLRFTRAEWEAFRESIKLGEFDSI